MTGIGDLCAAAQGGTLKLQAVVITDWRDGPIEGIARLSAGDGLWKFKIFAAVARVDDLDERLFLFFRLSQDAEEQILSVVAGLRLPLVWPFDEQPNSSAITSAVNVALESAMSETLVVCSVDFDTVLKAWLIESDPR
jgi:hypothetical protein